MPKERTGSIKYQPKSKLFLVRLTYTDATGRRHDLRRLAESKTEANQKLKKLLRDLDDHGERIIDGERLTFARLAEIYKAHKLKPPVYKGETRISGLRSWKSQIVFLKPLVGYFGRMRIRVITHGEIEKYKASRSRTETRRGGERSVAAVNRELATLRAVLNFAKRSGWLLRNPFEMGEGLISAADETRRDRILTRAEETRLLAVCTGKRAHLRPLIIAAVDTALRRGELFKLKWMDVDFGANLIRVRKTTTKTWEARTIGMTARLSDELRRLHRYAPPDPEGLVFGITSDVKRSFATACQLVSIEGLHFHDLRHTATTRMIQSGMPAMEVMKITGHRQMSTFLRYLNADNETARRAATALDAFNTEPAVG